MPETLTLKQAFCDHGALRIYDSTVLPASTRDLCLTQPMTLQSSGRNTASKRAFIPQICDPGDDYSDVYESD